MLYKDPPGNPLLFFSHGQISEGYRQEIRDKLASEDPQQRREAGRSLGGKITQAERHGQEEEAEELRHLRGPQGQASGGEEFELSEGYLEDVRAGLVSDDPERRRQVRRGLSFLA